MLTELYSWPRVQGRQAGRQAWFLDPAHCVAFQPCRHFRLPLSLPSCSPRVFAASVQVSEEL